MKNYIVRLFNHNGFTDHAVEKPDLEGIKIDADVYRIEFRPADGESLFTSSKGTTKHLDQEKINYFIGEVITREDAINGKIYKDNHAYRYLVYGGDKQLLLARDGEFYLMQAEGTVLSPSDIDENGHYIKPTGFGV